MNVYVLKYWVGSCYRIEGVFATLEAAQIFAIGSSYGFLIDSFNVRE